jgi:hypothetical protein
VPIRLAAIRLIGRHVQCVGSGTKSAEISILIILVLLICEAWNFALLCYQLLLLRWLLCLLLGLNPFGFLEFLFFLLLLREGFIQKMEVLQVNPLAFRQAVFGRDLVLLAFVNIFL